MFDHDNHPDPAVARKRRVPLVLLAISGLCVVAMSSQSLWIDESYTVPLQLATYMGLIVSLGAFLGALFTLGQTIFAEQFAKFGMTPGPHGIPTPVISTLFPGGVQLIRLGIPGEYLGRIYDEVKGRPHWIIQDCAGLEAKTISEQCAK
jgi:hypothetical protein